jgi:hypothetical protein
MSTMLDAYTIRARLWPALLVALPLGLTTLALLLGSFQAWDALWSLIVLSGGTALLAEIGRDFGKKKEPRLFQLWCGKPTIRMLRHRDTPDSTALILQHRQLEQLIPGLKLPTPEDEKKKPLEADRIYEKCVEFLRVKTRDRKKFPLVFEENCNYGFRRNLWGMKPLGVAISILSFAVIGIAISLDYFVQELPPSPMEIACGLISLLLLLGWITLFTPKWVRVPAEAYAQRLLESCYSI